MFIPSLPTGYLISRCLIRSGQETHFKWTLAAGMLGGIFQDVDLCITICATSPPTSTPLGGHIDPVRGKASDTDVNCDTPT